ncbi:MAG: EamA family transporter [Bosea sp.]|uniref:DMT family transporter n=1 Tax=Bosea sp. (in: a-proteobacteria) TaxID=1871050 RepID=UPI001AC715C1|nr:EamA family transporter [Bosea sp. (in: a-proteobacteria)]MBN9451531.1 EamA family transporter [Bosea sp. (in: a-proteobacteria)]
MSDVPAVTPVSRMRQALIWIAFIALDTGTQLAFKWGADSLGDLDFGPAMLARAVAHPGVWLAILGYVGIFVAWMAILRDMPLSRAFPMTGLVYITVPLLAWIVFGERVDPIRAGGIALIIAGVVLLGGGNDDA